MPAPAPNPRPAKRVRTELSVSCGTQLATVSFSHDPTELDPANPDDNGDIKRIKNEIDSRWKPPAGREAAEYAAEQCLRSREAVTRVVKNLQSELARQFRIARNAEIRARVWAGRHEACKRKQLIAEEIKRLQKQTEEAAGALASESSATRVAEVVRVSSAALRVAEEMLAIVCDGSLKGVKHVLFVNASNKVVSVGTVLRFKAITDSNRHNMYAAAGVSDDNAPAVSSPHLCRFTSIDSLATPAAIPAAPISQLDVDGFDYAV
jgi:hypothetical protein